MVVAEAGKSAGEVAGLGAGVVVTTGGATGSACFLKGQWMQAVNINGSSQRTNLAGDLIRLNPSCFQHWPTEDAGVPNP
jgi:hypothetical protein